MGVAEHATLLIKIQELQSQLAQSTSAAAIFITETKLIDNASILSWNDTLSFPMLVKNSSTGERNVLCLKNLEAENVPDMSTFSDEGSSQLYIKLSVPPTGATTGEDGVTYLHLQLLSHERRSSDKLIAQGLIQVRSPATGEKQGRILLHLNCVVKGLADYVLFRCQYEWRTSRSAVEQPKLVDFGMPADLSYEIRQQLRIKHLVFEARQRYDSFSSAWTPRSGESSGTHAPLCPSSCTGTTRSKCCKRSTSIKEGQI